MKYFVTLLLMILFSNTNVFAIPTGDACLPQPDLTGFTIIQGSITFAGNAVYEDNIYVFGSVSLSDNSGNNDTTFTGSIYATGDIYVGKGVTVTGFAYSEGTLTQHNQGNVQVLEGTCSGGEPIPPIDLPVDELIGQCNDIFQEAAQSYANIADLHMQGGTQILDSQTNEFPFSSISGDQGESGTEPAPDGCGAGITCGIKSPPSTPLSDFFIPTITGNNISAWSGDELTLGGNNDDQYSGTVFGKVTAGDGGVISFIEQDYNMGRMYTINELAVQQGGRIRVTPGVYAVNKLNIPDRGVIEIVGSGDVYIFEQTGTGVRSFDVIKQDSSSQFYYISNNSISFQSFDTFYGAIYVNGNLTLGNDIKIIGQVAAQNLIMQSNASIVNDVVCGEPPAGSNEFKIVTGSNALTCEPHPVTLQVLDSNGDIDTDYEGIVDLKVTDPKGNWSMIIDNTRLDNNPPDNGAATYEFKSSDNGEVDLALAITEVIDVSLDMSEGALAAAPVAVSFQSSMIKVEKCSVPAAVNIECINTDTDPVTANRPFSLKLTAYKSDESQKCINYDPNNIAFWSEYKSPNSGTLVVDIEGVPIGIDSNSAVALPIAFSSGIATVSGNYPDAGKIEINLKDADIHEINGVIETIVNPYKLVIDNITETERDKDPLRIEGSGFIRASVPDYNELKVDTFELTAKAIIDCTSEGVAKNCPSIGETVYKIAPNFNHDIELLVSKNGDYELGTLYYDSDSLTVALTDGKFTYKDLAYNEVGNINLQLESLDYFQKDNHVPVDDVKEVGHFYPDYLAWGDYNLDASCNGFTYLSEKNAEFSYFLRAYNQGVSPSVTENYDPNRGYSVAPAGNFKHYAFAGTTELTSRLLVDDYYNEANWILGNYAVEPQKVGVDRIANTPDGPYFVDDNTAEYWVELIGNDGEKIDAISDCSGDRCLLGNLGDLVYGRLQAGNGHGSEFQPIRTLVETTYFNGNQFVPFTRDDCTQILFSPIENQQVSAKPSMSVDKIIVGSGETTLKISNSPLISGKTYFEFSAPQSRGTLNYFIRLQDFPDPLLPSIYTPWLLDNGNTVTCPSDADGLDECISGYVEFGLFRGNDRVIYRMQTFD